MFEEPFANGDSFIHHIGPCHRIVAAVAFSFVVGLTDSFSPLIIAVIISLLLAIVARLNPRDMMRRLMVVFGFLLLIWLVLPLTVDGAVLFRIGPIALSRPGIVLAARITLKVLAILVMFTALVATMPLTTLGHALHRLMVSKKIVYLILMTQRYIHLLENEYQRTIRALRMRGFIPRTNLHTYKTYAYLIGMLFVRSMARAERIEWAMRCRGFNGRFYDLAVFPSLKASWRFSGIMGLIIIVIAILEWGPRSW
ncbi:MAG: cobalt ECF transporter T component CbiQ [Thermodesulfobacteriota bacterium]|nr:cobalt ECF transporter T component CbiQ [Thermodesulfobacteriota bacterium]